MMIPAIAITAASIIILFLIFCYACFLHACKRNRHRDPAASGGVNLEKFNEHKDAMKGFLNEYEALKKESVCITSFDSLRLYASYIPSAEKTERLVIAFHGYRSCAAADFAPICSFLRDNGCSLLLVDQRSHGRSEGKYIGFGALERRDAQAWCEYAENRFGKDIKIYLHYWH